MAPGYVFAFAFGIGIVAGLRTFLAPAAVAWAIQLGWLNLHRSALIFLESGVVFAILSVLAVGELIADLFPNIPKRTAPAPLAARIVSGGYCGSCLCAASHQSLMIGGALGAVGAVAGAFVGYKLRGHAVTKFKIPDFVVALCEDAIAVGLALFCVSR
jgi:uncharacterized membrane protein